MDNYEEILRETIGLVCEQALREFRGQNIEICEYNAIISELSDEIMSDEGVDAKIKQKFNKYANTLHLLSALEGQHLYIQGAKDCVALLKGLGVIQ